MLPLSLRRQAQRMLYVYPHPDPQLFVTLVAQRSSRPPDVLLALLAPPKPSSMHHRDHVAAMVVHEADMSGPTSGTLPPQDALPSIRSLLDHPSPQDPPQVPGPLAVSHPPVQQHTAHLLGPLSSKAFPGSGLSGSLPICRSSTLVDDCALRNYCKIPIR